MFCHRSSIAAQWISSAERLNLKLKDWQPGLGASDLAQSHGLLITYQAAGRNLDALEQQLRQWNWGPWLAIADEVHHLGVDPEEPEATAWGYAFSRLSERAQLRLGLTGTPFRADNLGFCAARRIQVHDGQEWVEQIAPDLSVEPRELIQAGVCAPWNSVFKTAGWTTDARGTPATPNAHPSPRKNGRAGGPGICGGRSAWGTAAASPYACC